MDLPDLEDYNNTCIQTIVLLDEWDGWNELDG
jgi:hypothetical protein